LVSGEGGVRDESALQQGPSTFTRYSERIASARAAEAPVVDLRRQSFLNWLDFPFASVSVLVLLGTLFMVSMALGGWSWSSWTYTFALGIAVPLTVLEVKRKAVITGWAAVLLIATAIVDAGLPRYFGYTPSDLSWYDLLAHYLGTILLTVFVWTMICWTVSPDGPPRENGRRKFWTAIMVMLVVSVFFEFLEYFTDIMFGWTNFHVGIDTVGDLIFDIAGVLTAALAISRHRVSLLKRPFWHAEGAAS
jgi:magnesium-transporting ATPase (P-type)